MPPFVGRKRLSQSPPVDAKRPPSKRIKPNRDAPQSKKSEAFSLDSESDSSLTDIESDDFEDVRVDRKNQGNGIGGKDDAGSEDEDEDVEWEDAGGQAASAQRRPTPEIRDLKITIRKEEEPDYGAIARAGKGKTGPTKREKLARVQTHQMHVQFLLWHNSIRNRWINDKEVHKILLQQLPAQIVREVERWRRASGLDVGAQDSPSSTNNKAKKKTRREIPSKDRNWSKPSSRLESGKADMSQGDPLITFLKILSAYWKKKFAITAPGLRKRGYGTKHGLRQEIESFRNEIHNPAKHGERIRTLEEFRELARKCEGSRDAGAQLFTALLRGLGIDARLVASLQPAGYGWTKAEQMIPRKPIPAENVDISSDSGSDDTDPEPVVKRRKSTKLTNKSVSINQNLRRPEGIRDAPIDLDTDADTGDDYTTGENIKDDDSVIDVTPSMPKAKPAKFDKDLAFPIYWTEAVSPVTQKVLPVSPLVLASPVASSPEALSLFEPRGAKADKTRQVIAYVVAYSSDGTAKDVTVRYLRKKFWPGKTKAFRFPIEKIPIYDKRGKIRRYEDYDWFKYTLSAYTRSDTQRTAVDDIEDSIDLVPAEPEKKPEPEFDTLQSLKSSPEFVLERFLRREEALKPAAEPVRYFTPPTTKKSKSSEEPVQEPVYNRSDVLRCLTAESWHKEGRRPLPAATALKLVPVRAVTLTRKREAEEHEARTGQKQMQGLYSQDQTEWIIPPPISNGVIPKNAYGNIDAFVPSMVPKGAVHIPLNGLKRICKKLEIDFAEAVTGFEFGNKMAVPVITGVVVAKEHEKSVRESWKQWNEEQRRKEETKMEKLVLDLWRKFVIGLRIRERVRDEYGGDIGTDMSGQKGRTKDDAIHIDDNDQFENTGPGGFLPEAEEDEFGGGFLLPHEDDAADVGELIMDEGYQSPEKHKPHEKQAYDGEEEEESEVGAPLSHDQHDERLKLSRLMAQITAGIRHAIPEPAPGKPHESNRATQSTSLSPYQLNGSTILAKGKGYKSINQRIRERDEFGRKKSKRPAVIAESSNSDSELSEVVSIIDGDVGLSNEDEPDDDTSNVPKALIGDSSGELDDSFDSSGSDEDDEDEYTPDSRTSKSRNKLRTSTINDSGRRHNETQSIATANKLVKTSAHDNARRTRRPPTATGKPSSPSPRDRRTRLSRAAANDVTTETNSPTKQKTPQRSARRSRKDKEIVTSPYFDHE